MLRLIGVKPISLWFLRETRLLRAFGTKGTSKPDRPPRVPRSETQGKKFPLKPKFKHPESENLDELLASAGISELMAGGLSGIPTPTKPGDIETDQVGSIPPLSEPKATTYSSENKLQTKEAAETFADSPLRLLNLLSVVDHKHCRGCGAVFQFEQAHREGYVDLTRLDKRLQKREAAETPDVSQVLRSLISERTGSGGVSHKLRALKTMSNTTSTQTADLLEEQQPVKELAKEALADGHTEMYSVEDYLNDTIGLENIEHLENLFEDKIVQKDICDRCVHLKNNDVDKVRAVEINLESSF